MLTAVPPRRRWLVTATRRGNAVTTQRRASGGALLARALLAALVCAGCGQATGTALGTAGARGPASVTAARAPARPGVGTEAPSPSTSAAGGPAAQPHKCPAGGPVGPKQRTALRRAGFRPLGPPVRWQGLTIVVGYHDIADAKGQRAFFFAGPQLLGTDAARPSYVVSPARCGPSGITLSYLMFQPADGGRCVPDGNSAEVTFAWTGSALRRTGSLPPIHGCPHR